MIRLSIASSNPIDWFWRLPLWQLPGWADDISTTTAAMREEAEQNGE
ncbi:MAG: hypothetical protein VB035_06165 [Candidatus Fimivivens sp.]|nr:hypothetical protein [Candidatus Fimivivens sp.]